MPASTLHNGPKNARRYDVIGVYSEPSESFVRHVGLYSPEGGTLSYDEEVDVTHMGPPLKRSGKATAHVIGTVPLTNEEVKEIGSWIEEVDDEYRRVGVAKPEQQYCIHPPWRDEVDKNTGARRYRRYSCAGFVLCAYGEVRIRLLDVEQPDLPDVEEQTVLNAYPRLYPLLRGHPDRLDGLGLEGTPPWRIVLAGYLFHALNRPTDQIRGGPYRVRPGDETFP